MIAGRQSAQELLRAYQAAKVAAAGVSFEDALRDPVWAALLHARASAFRAAHARARHTAPLPHDRQESLCI